MKIRKPRCRSEQPSLQPLLQPAQETEKHENEVDRENAELLIGYLHAARDQHDAQRNSKAPSTTSEDLPEPETGKEVVLRSVSPSSLQVQDGEERETSMANALEVNGDVGNEKQGEQSKPCTGLASLAIAIRELQGPSNPHPLLLTEESESGSEVPTWIHPSSAPEGSLLHALYLQLLGAGTDGITVRDLYKCLKKPAEVLSFALDWKVQVRGHLKTNPHFCQAQEYHYLVSDHQLQVQQPKCSHANIASTSRRHEASSSRSVLSTHHSTPATVQPGHSVDTHEGVVPTRRKAFQKAMAALSEQATEEMHQSMGDMQRPSSVADPTDSQLVSHEPFLTSSRKRKSPSSDEEELTPHGYLIPGDLQATQARILANLSEAQKGQRCVVMKDDTGNWRCKMMAMAGDTVCNHHRSLQQQEDGKTTLSPRVQCGHSHKSKDGTWSSECSRIAMKGHRLCAHHKQLREESKARQSADAQQGKQDATNLQYNPDSSIICLPESLNTNLDQSLVPHHPKSATTSPRISREDTPSRAKNVDKPATGVANHDDDSNAEQLQQQMPEIGPKRRHVAARKTAANVGPLKAREQIRTPTIPPLPPPYGVRRKTPVKNRDH